MRKEIEESKGQIASQPQLEEPGIGHPLVQQLNRLN